MPEIPTTVEEFVQMLICMAVSGADGGKDNALLRLKEWTRAKKLTVFGDNTNDLPMFRVADRALAVTNAKDEVKAAADEVIGANTADGVAEYLQKEWTV